MRLVILVDWPTNRLSGFAVDIQISSKALSLLGSNAFGDFVWPQMSSNVWEKGFGGFQSPLMFCAVLGNAKVA